ncbi:MAG: polyprenol monophosphomannose synthase [Chitinophagales bacterium]|nr:polyprenol monophosphomannose synthase [Chitinophagales bacterium]MDW8428295.1 polyprenol monophosphomannose synthase [Chitinophagales bacterium]
MTVADSLIIIPTYNEGENIVRLLPELLRAYPHVHVLVVDDNSPDGTAQRVEALQVEYADRLFLMRRQNKQGLGTAYIAGFRWALNRTYQFIFEMDADFSHPIRYIQDLFDACAQQGYDVAIGSRYVKGGGVQNWPAARVLMSYYASVYVRLITWMPVQDTTAGFVCYRRYVLETIDLSRIRFVGYAFQIEMKYAAWCLGFRIKEVPIIFVDRIEGSSKMNKSIVREAALGVLRMRWQSLFRSYRNPSAPR